MHRLGVESTFLLQPAATEFKGKSSAAKFYY